MDVCDFECNICLELAQDPIVTPCGHLYCWPCIYKWHYFHSQSNECPVCKAMIHEKKLVPLYGRGKSTCDPRSRPVSGLCIPDRPSGQRPETGTSNVRNNNFGNNRYRFSWLFQPSNGRLDPPHHYEVDMDRMRRQVNDLLYKTVLLGFGFLILFIYIEIDGGGSKS